MEKQKHPTFLFYWCVFLWFTMPLLCMKAGIPVRVIGSNIQECFYHNNCQNPNFLQMQIRLHHSCDSSHTVSGVLWSIISALYVLLHASWSDFWHIYLILCPEHPKLSNIRPFSRLKQRRLSSHLLCDISEMLLVQADDAFNLLTSVGQMFWLFTPNLV